MYLKFFVSIIMFASFQSTGYTASAVPPLDLSSEKLISDRLFIFDTCGRLTKVEKEDKRLSELVSHSIETTVGTMTFFAEPGRIIKDTPPTEAASEEIIERGLTPVVVNGGAGDCTVYLDVHGSPFTPRTPALRDLGASKIIMFTADFPAAAGTALMKFSLQDLAKRVIEGKL